MVAAVVFVFFLRHNARDFTVASTERADSRNNTGLGRLTRKSWHIGFCISPACTRCHLQLAHGSEGRLQAHCHIILPPKLLMLPEADVATKARTRSEAMTI